MKSERGAKSDEPRFVNSTIEIGAKANCFLNRFNPRHGTIMLGDGGMDFVAGTGYGFVSIPWTSVQKVRVDVYGKHVRSIDVVTEEGPTIPFVVSNGYEVLRVVHAHVGREKIFSAGHSLGMLARVLHR